jgi:ribosome-associated protein
MNSDSRQHDVATQLPPSILRITASVQLPLAELRFRTSRSSGPGGQNVNKLETRVELLFNVAHSPSLGEEQRQRVLTNLGSRIDGDGVLHISSQRSRSQWENKQVTIEKFVLLLRETLKIRKKRIKTGPTRGSNENRVRHKKKHSQKKRLRKVHLGDE